MTREEKVAVVEAFLNGMVSGDVDALPLAGTRVGQRRRLIQQAARREARNECGGGLLCVQLAAGRLTGGLDRGLRGPVVGRLGQQALRLVARQIRRRGGTVVGHFANVLCPEWRRGRRVGAARGPWGERARRQR